MEGYEESVKQYFAQKASAYDRVEEQVYWRLSDSLLWTLLEEHVLNCQKPAFKFLDAGGGTGRWTERILRQYPESTGTIVDASRHMLAEAEAKRQRGLQARLTLEVGDLQCMDNLPDAAFDLATCFHNVLGFVVNAKKALEEIVRVVAEGGRVAFTFPNRYHCAYFNLKLGRLTEAERVLETGRGRFAFEMPLAHMFTPSQVVSLLESLDVRVDFITGFPVLIYPGMEETQLTGSSEPTRLLDDPKSYGSVLKLELDATRSSESAARGNQILVVGTKTSTSH